MECALAGTSSKNRKVTEKMLNARKDPKLRRSQIVEVEKIRMTEEPPRRMKRNLKTRERRLLQP